MISVKEVIIVEGTYDKIRLSSFIDGIIFVTGGFSIMNTPEKIKGLAGLVRENGGVILTDSDSAGLRIRNYLKKYLPSDKIKHAYVPEIMGKEKRKNKPGAEGLLGVEGMTEELIINALMNAGCCINNSCSFNSDDEMSISFLYELGLTGDKNSSKYRRALSQKLGIPTKLSTNMLRKYLSQTITCEELKQIVKEIKNSSL